MTRSGWSSRAGGGDGEAHVGQVAGAVAVGAEGEHDPEPVGQADLLVAQVEAVGEPLTSSAVPVRAAAR